MKATERSTESTPSETAVRTAIRDLRHAANIAEMHLPGADREWAGRSLLLQLDAIRRDLRRAGVQPLKRARAEADLSAHVVREHV